MSLSANHFGYLLFAGALVVSDAGCHMVRTLSSGFADCAPAGAQPELVSRDRGEDYQFDRPPAPPATLPGDVPASPMPANPLVDASHPKEGDRAESADFPIEPVDAGVIVARLEARGAKITRNADLSVVTIDLSNTDVIDADLEHLELFDRLQELNLGGTRISNATLDHLPQERELEFLGLTGTRIDDEGVQQIARLKSIRFLSLAGTDLTDRGLDAISRMRNLEAVNLRATRVSPAGIAALQSRLPACRIVHESVGDGESSGLFENPGHLSRPVGRQSEPIRLYPTPPRGAAERRLEIVMRRKLCDPDVLHALAAVRAAEGKWSEAQASLRFALEQCPDDRALRFDYAVTLVQSHDLEAAYQQFERAVGRAAAHHNMGVMLVEQGWFAAGRRHFQAALAADPTLSSAHDWLAYIDGDSLHPGDGGGPGMISSEEFRSLFGSLLSEEEESPLGGDGFRQDGIERRSTRAHEGPADSVFEPASPFEAINTSFRPVNANAALNR